MYQSLFPETAKNGYQLPGTIDFWYKPLNTYYGRIDQQGDVVIPNAARTKALLPYGSDNTNLNLGPIYVLDFVADAFNYFQAYMSHGAPAQKIKGSPWESVKPVRAWTGNSDSYNEYINIFASSFIDRYLYHHRKSENVFNAKDFVKTFFGASEKMLINLPLSRTSFVLSKNCSILDTGLCIDLSEQSYSEDFEKFEKWVKDPSFDYFRYEAANHGFMVDKNAPWRLVANLNSPLLNKILLRYDVNPSNFFDTYYHKTYLSDVQELKNNLFYMYNSFVQKFPFEMIPCGQGEKTQVTRHNRFPVIREEYDKMFDDVYWLEKYFLLRVIEEKVPWGGREFSRYSKNMRLANKFVDFRKALDYINNSIIATKTLLDPAGTDYTSVRHRQGASGLFTSSPLKKPQPHRPGNVKPHKGDTTPPTPSKEDWYL